MDVRASLDDQLAGIEGIEEYSRKTFSSERDLYIFMEKIRRSTPCEAVGFIVSNGEEAVFYYRITEDTMTTELPEYPGNSWHSHPDSDISEVNFNEEDLPEELPGEIMQVVRYIAENYGSVDEPSPKKISLIDIINVAIHGREKDVLSMPPHHVLSIRFRDAAAPSLIRAYSDTLNNYWATLVESFRKRSDGNNFGTLRFGMWVDYYSFAIAEFKKILESLGREKMTAGNFLEVLWELGLPYDYQEV